MIRAAGVEAIGAVLNLLLKDSVTNRIHYYTLIWKQIRKKLPPSISTKIEGDNLHSSHQIASWQGSLLCLGELMDGETGSKKFMWPRFVLTCTTVLEFTREGFDRTVYEAVVRLVPRLAEVRYCNTSI